MQSEKVFNQLILAHLCLLFQALLKLISDSVKFQFFAKNRPKLLKQRHQGNDGSERASILYLKPLWRHHARAKGVLKPKMNDTDWLTR